ncbi:hypothetical protein GCM10007981_17580 [Thermocladium modestius]|uniref:Uncharacterized protein n=1 Tax=Thermocladium modestius TaxID=62609 RepID=A0A830GXL9_9CREN|nr:hypothetical protein [Thermocladium modestius]GGP22254.1 hypothetical protein GCM10007981_17580 [Thermocladium modestius]
MSWRGGLLILLLVIVALMAYELLMGVVISRSLMMVGLMGIRSRGRGRRVQSVKELLRRT